jgi:hypothetical protein
MAILDAAKKIAGVGFAAGAVWVIYILLKAAGKV